MVRGVNRQTIFEDDEDYVIFIDTIQESKEKSGFKFMDIVHRQGDRDLSGEKEHDMI